MTPLAMIQVWLGGCSCAPKEHPEECLDCTRALIDALEPALKKERAEVRATLERTQRLFDEALPKFDWGKSPLDANAICLLNEVPGEVRAMIERLGKEGEE